LPATVRPAIALYFVETEGASKMLKTNKKQALRNLFIFSTSIEERVNQKIQHLTFQARQAYYERNYRQVAIVGTELVNLSSRSESAGRYFQALALSQQGKSDNDEAQLLFKELINQASKPVKAASLLALGVTAYQQNNFKEAQILINEAQILANYNDCAPLTSVLSKTAMAAIYSGLGNYEESLQIIKAGMPRIISWGNLFPSYLGMELNNYAYDLCQSGDSVTASRIIKNVIQLPFISAYPEWLETAKEIEQAQTLTTRNHSTITVPIEYNRGEILGNLLHFPLPKKRFHICLHHGGYHFKLLDFIINASEESQDRFVALLQCLEGLTTDEDTGIVIYGYPSPDDMEILEFERNIEKSLLNDLYLLVRNVICYEKENPQPDTFQGVRMDQASL
jgi:tetratricopeptide (TPR) repeat protein